MKQLAIVGTLICLLGNLSAEEHRVDSTITAVTVFSDRAEVTRSASLELGPGLHQVRFENLPAYVDPETLQLEGQGTITLQDIRIKREFLSEVVDEMARKLYTQKDDLQQNLRKVELAFSGVEQQRKSLDAIWKRLTTTPTQTDTAPAMNPEQWADMLSFQTKQARLLDEQVLALEFERKQTKERIVEIEKQIQQHHAKRNRVRVDAIVVLEVSDPTRAVLELAYQVRGPSWHPSYQVRADSNSKSVAISYRANVRQNTGEDWSNVSLSLSTAQPQIGGREPELTPWRIGPYTPEVLSQPRSRAVGDVSELLEFSGMENTIGFADYSFRESLDAEGGEVPMKVAGATVQAGVTASVFDVPGDVSIPADGQPVIATILSFDSAAHFRHTAVPKLSPHVYLKANVTNESQAQLLPGTGSVFIDGNFVGKAPLELVAPSEQFWVYLGVDPAVQVERKSLEGEAGTEGLFSKRTRTVHRYEFEIKNNRTDAIDMVLWDQIPMASDEEIEVRLIEPRYSGKDTDELVLTNEKFIEWGLKVDGKATTAVPFVYSIEHPEEMLVSGL
ncbi:MAG: mucoidy inhibitor MuiA family protein [Verrucomicrobiota bacterium]